MHIVVTGASGLIGSALVPALRGDGHTVVRLVRRDPRDAGEARWDPAAGVLDAAPLAAADAVVHLAGAGIGDRRWTAAYKRTLRESRLAGTALLAGVLATLDGRPRTWLSASAVGWYGDTGDQPVDESAPAGSGFLADLARDWEAATGPAAAAGVRVCHLRTGVVLSHQGGALGRQVPLFRLGLGARLGSGRQYLSWIGLPDVIAAIRFLLDADGSAPASTGDRPSLAEPVVTGPVNLTAPTPVTNAQFTRALAAAVHRPAPLVAPPFALRLALGEFAHEGLLAGQRVVPHVLTTAGFTFTHPTLPEALHSLLPGTP
jgi:uncharacterized protein